MLPSASLRLQIEQQFARLGLHIQRGQLQIRQPKADLQITQPKARMEIDQGPGVLLIDNEDARAALALKPIGRMTAEMAERAKQIGLEGIAQIAEEGDILAQINGPSIADIAQQRMGEERIPVYEPGPPALPHITYIPHSTKVDWQLEGAKIHSTIRKPEITYTPGYVQSYLIQKNWIHFSVKGKYMNRTF